MNNPKIFLAIDNCFASKRWTEPAEWISVIKDLGLFYVEASADNECDPMYMGSEYLSGWTAKVKSASTQTGVKVVNLYSGHGTYATLGLAHTDKNIRDRFLNEWLKPMSRAAGELGAGLGFFCHAFSDAVLQDPIRYLAAEDDLYARLAELADYASSHACRSIGVEQMYTPHQIPWTVSGADKLLREVNRRSKSPFYLTIDTGHQCGQRKFVRPDLVRLKDLLRNARNGTVESSVWLGPKSAYAWFQEVLRQPVSIEDTAIAEIDREMDKYPHLFATYEDGDPYRWLELLGCYSPIVHLQQTTGKSSAHLPFTKEHNATGIISGDKVLQALSRAYQNGQLPEGMPKKCDEIYLTLEMFSGTAELNCDILNRLRETVRYWRTYIPEDGLTLNQLLK